MPEGRDKWFTAMLAIIIVLLGCVGSMVLFLNSQTWTKLDRITALFLHERDLLNTKMEGVCVEQGHIKERLTAVEIIENQGKKK